MGRKARTHCRNCGIEFTPFNQVSNLQGYNSPMCRECYLVDKKERYERTKSSEQFRRWNLKNKYGITPEEYNYLYEFQQFGCAICRMPFDKLHVDHNHETGETRGLLCVKCNVIVGHIENNEDLVVDAIEYIKRHTKKKEVA